VADASQRRLNGPLANTLAISSSETEKGQHSLAFLLSGAEAGI
jgi:hypothetical protein